MYGEPKSKPALIQKHSEIKKKGNRFLSTESKEQR